MYETVEVRVPTAAVLEAEEYVSPHVCGVGSLS